MSPGGRETATSGGEREDSGPGLLTVSHILQNIFLLM